MANALNLPTIPVTPLDFATFPPKPEPEPKTKGKAKQGPPLAAAPKPRAYQRGDPPPKALEDSGLSEGQQWHELVGALRLHRRRLLRIPGVTAVDVGYKIKDGSFTNKLALRVHFERKLPEASVKNFKGLPCDWIAKEPSQNPEEWFLSPRGYKVTMDVLEGDYMPAQLGGPPRPRMLRETPQKQENVSRRSRLDPLVGGISIGSPNVPVGTLGALVWDNTDGSVCILSNWHVLSGDLQGEVGTPCFQPGRFDQGRSSDVVAHLKRWSFDSQTDAAIAELNECRHYCAGEIVSLYQQISDVTDPYLGMVVLKSGRSTERTWGFIDGLYFSSAIEYSNGLMQVFEEQIHIAPTKPNDRISEGGDSGAVWVTPSNGEGYLAVGLHFAGDLPHSAFGEYALANPMRIVAKRLNFLLPPSVSGSYGRGRCSGARAADAATQRRSTTCRHLQSEAHRLERSTRSDPDRLGRHEMSCDRAARSTYCATASKIVRNRGSSW